MSNKFISIFYLPSLIEDALNCHGVSVEGDSYPLRSSKYSEKKERTTIEVFFFKIMDLLVSLRMIS